MVLVNFCLVNRSKIDLAFLSMVHAEKTVGSLPENGSGGARGAARGSPRFLDQTEARRPEGPKVWIRH